MGNSRLAALLLLASAGPRRRASAEDGGWTLEEAKKGLVGFPVGWRNASLCFAQLAFASEGGASLAAQAHAAADHFCHLVPFESMVHFGDHIAMADIANPAIRCTTAGQGLPTIPIDAGGGDPAYACAPCARQRCIELVGMALQQKVVHVASRVATGSGQVVDYIAWPPPWTAPRAPLPPPALSFHMGPRAATGLLAPADDAGPDRGGTLAAARLGGPLRVLLWPALCVSCFFRERRLVEAGIQRHPSLTLVANTRDNDAWGALFSAAVYGERLPHPDALAGEHGRSLFDRLMRRRRLREGRGGGGDSDDGGGGGFVGGGALLSGWLACDVVAWVRDDSSAATPFAGSSTVEGQRRYLSLLDPRGVVPRSRLLVLDFRDTPAKRASPGLDREARSRAESGAGRNAGAPHSAAAFVAAQGCAVYLERSTAPRGDGAFLDPAGPYLLSSASGPRASGVSVGGFAAGGFAPGSSARARLPLHVPLDFTVADEVLPRAPNGQAPLGSRAPPVSLDAHLTSAMPELSTGRSNGEGEKGKMGDDEAELAAVWAAERPIKLACLLRPASNQVCRVRAVRWAAELCRDLSLAPHECVVGPWDDTVRQSFDASYLSLLRSSQVRTLRLLGWSGMSCSTQLTNITIQRALSLSLSPALTTAIAYTPTDTLARTPGGGDAEAVQLGRRLPDL